MVMMMLLTSSTVSARTIACKRPVGHSVWFTLLSLFHKRLRGRLQRPRVALNLVNRCVPERFGGQIAERRCGDVDSALTHR